MDLSPGADFGAYRIEGVLGRGGMAVVCRAYEAVGFNTWKGVAKEALKQIEEWLEGLRNPS